MERGSCFQLVPLSDPLHSHRTCPLRSYWNSLALLLPWWMWTLLQRLRTPRLGNRHWCLPLLWRGWTLCQERNSYWYWWHYLRRHGWRNQEHVYRLSCAFDIHQHLHHRRHAMRVDCCATLVGQNGKMSYLIHFIRPRLLIAYITNYELSALLQVFQVYQTSLIIQF